MSETDQNRSEPERKPRSIADLLWVLLPMLLGAVILGVAGQYGSKFQTTADTSLILATKVDQLLDRAKTREEQDKNQDAQLRELLQKLAQLPTREEFQRYQEAADRRFQRLDGDIADIRRRLDGLELTVRLGRKQ